jgi:hypothetical protein
VTVALLAAAAALALPTPPAAPAVPAPGVNGPARLRDVWPSARTFSFDAWMPGGVGFTPMLVVDPTTVVGVALAADLSFKRLVVRTGDAQLRVLQELRTAEVTDVAAVAVSGDQLFWLDLGSDGQDRRTTTVWRSGLRSGQPRLISTAVSDLMFLDSQYDLELAGGRLYWAAFVSGGRGEIRSVSVDGGPVTVRSFDRVYGLTTWPWATSPTGGGQAGDVDLLNLVTGEHRTVRGSGEQYLSCTPAWCRVTTLTNQKTDAEVTLEYPDGSHVVRFADPSLSPVNTDVALLDRFEVAESLGNPNTAIPTQKIWLHDLTNGRDILLDESTTAYIGSRDGFLWWSTGDNEATVWQFLDLRQLT